MNVTGHRGAAALAPENTIAGYRLAIELGVDAIELDARLSADDELVIMHDETVDRTTNGTGRVRELSVRELKVLDAGSGEEIPTLAEALDILAGSNVRIRIELKERSIGERVVDAVVARGIEQRVTLSSFLHDALEPVRNAPVRIGVITSELSQETLDTVDSLGADALFVNLDTVTETDVEAVGDSVELGVWTVNDPEAVDRAINLGADSITTDHPDRVISRLRT